MVSNLLDIIRDARVRTLNNAIEQGQVVGPSLSGMKKLISHIQKSTQAFPHNIEESERVAKFLAKKIPALHFTKEADLIIPDLNQIYDLVNPSENDDEKTSDDLLMIYISKLSNKAKAKVMDKLYDLFGNITFGVVNYIGYLLIWDKNNPETQFTRRLLSPQGLNIGEGLKLHVNVDIPTHACVLELSTPTGRIEIYPSLSNDKSDYNVKIRANKHPFSLESPIVYVNANDYIDADFLPEDFRPVDPNDEGSGELYRQLYDHYGELLEEEKACEMTSASEVETVSTKTS